MQKKVKFVPQQVPDISHEKLNMLENELRSAIDAWAYLIEPPEPFKPIPESMLSWIHGKPPGVRTKIAVVVRSTVEIVGATFKKRQNKK